MDFPLLVFDTSANNGSIPGEWWLKQCKCQMGGNPNPPKMVLSRQQQPSMGFISSSIHPKVLAFPAKMILASDFMRANDPMISGYEAKWKYTNPKLYRHIVLSEIAHEI